MASPSLTENEHASIAVPLIGRQQENLIQVQEIIGRQKEITEITQLLLNPACRLLTLVGLGGIGKTTLAHHLVNPKTSTQLQTTFPHGIYLIPLQSIQSPDLIASALADALDISLSSAEEPLGQLSRYLQDKALLLVLDNFEHLLTSVDTLTTILQAAPTAKAIVTSREALNLREEWLYPVHGLAYPHKNPTDGNVIDGNTIDNYAIDDTESYSAVELFSERAHRIRPDFSITDEYASIVRICQLVEGTPLALELAATWVKTLRCAEIASEIEQSLDFLTSRLRNVPDRHRSMLAVFEHSWQLLSPKEQAVFMRLCVFRGGFERKAAASVAGASLANLSSLADKSLLYVGGDGRYQMHELLRQYAQEKLEENPTEASQTYNAHCTYFTAFLHNREQNMLWGKRQQQATQEVDAELDNVRAALEWAIAQHKVGELVRSVQAYGLLNQYRSRYQESATTFEKMMVTFEHGNPTQEKQIGQILVSTYLGWVYIRLGQLDHAQHILRYGQTLYAESGIPPLPGSGTDPDAPLGVVCLIKGDYTGATSLGEASLQRNRLHEHQGNLCFAHYVLAGAALAQGQYELAHHHAYQAHTVAQKIEDRWFMAYCLIELGRAEQALGNLATATHHYQTTYALRQEFDDPEGMAVALNHLGKIALQQSDYPEAQQLYTQSHTIYSQLNDRGGLATALDGLGTAATALGDYPAAAQHFHASLQLAVDIQFVPRIFSLLIHIGEFFLKTDKETRGLALLAMTRAHPASALEAQKQATRLLEEVEPLVSPELYASATRWDPRDTIESVTASLLIELVAPGVVHPSTELVSPQPANPYSPAPPQPDLVEPLTSRELEILALLAQGLTNQQIAQELIVAIGTVKAHNHSIFGKLGVNNRTSAVARAQELHLL